MNYIKKLNTTDKQGHNDGNDVGDENHLWFLSQLSPRAITVLFGVN